MLFRHFRSQSASAPAQSDILHSAMKCCLGIVPKATLELPKYLSTSFPHKLSQTDTQVHYSTQIMHLTTYCPTLLPSVLSLMVRKCMEIDVEIRVEDGGEVKVEDEGDEDDGLCSGGGNMNSLVVGCDDGDSSRPQKPVESIEANVYADKLDTLLLLVFEKIRSLGPEASYSSLQDVFQTTVITTHKSKFTQFLYFYMCGLSSSSSAQGGAASEAILYREFTSYLIELSLNPDLPSVHRQSSACYLAR